MKAIPLRRYRIVQAQPASFSAPYIAQYYAPGWLWGGGWETFEVLTADAKRMEVRSFPTLDLARAFLIAHVRVMTNERFDKPVVVWEN